MSQSRLSVRDQKRGAGKLRGLICLGEHTSERAELIFPLGLPKVKWEDLERHWSRISILPRPPSTPVLGMECITSVQIAKQLLYWI